jgi:phosphoadenosine phosphosulfate reductase
VDFDAALRLLHRGAESLPERIAEMAAPLEAWPAEQIIATAAEYVPRLAVTSSFGAESVVLLHLVSVAAPELPVLFLDTGFHFPETLAYRDQLVEQLGLNVVDVTGEPWVQRQTERQGIELPLADPDTCCYLRKTVPLRAALKHKDGWVTGLRRSVTAERAATPVLQAIRQDGRWMFKVAPIALWSDDEVDDYIARHALPRNPLVERGYRSIGCAPCTRPVEQGEDARSGRWSHVPDKTECGLHLLYDDEEPATSA